MVSPKLGAWNCTDDYFLIYPIVAHFSFNSFQQISRRAFLDIVKTPSWVRSVERNGDYLCSLRLPFECGIRVIGLWIFKVTLTINFSAFVCLVVCLPCMYVILLIDAVRNGEKKWTPWACVMVILSILFDLSLRLERVSSNVHKSRMFSGVCSQTPLFVPISTEQ